jgi:ribosome-associated protein
VAFGGFTHTQRGRVLRVLDSRLVGGRLLVVAASEHRQQRRNRVAARERMADLLREAMAPPPAPRRATRPTRGSKERRLTAKKHRGETKARRSRPASDA